MTGATYNRGDMSSSPRIIPPVYFLLTLVAMLLLHWLAPVGRVIPPPLTWFGLVPLALGIFMSITAARAFARAGTPVRPFAESTALVTEGLFRISRNPMYLGMITTLIGVAILLGTATPFLPVPVFFFVLWHRFVQHEERILEGSFGETYREYRRRVRRWI